MIYVPEEIVNLDLDDLESDFNPTGALTAQNAPAIKFTIEEEFKICEVEAANDHVVKILFQTLVDNVPNFQESISLFLYSKAQGGSFDVSPVTILSWMEKCKYATMCKLTLFCIRMPIFLYFKGGYFQ